jgi:F420-0:gamma-glutamyl ligase
MPILQFLDVLLELGERSTTYLQKHRVVCVLDELASQAEQQVVEWMLSSLNTTKRKGKEG